MQLDRKTFKGGTGRPVARPTPSKAPASIEDAPINIFINAAMMAENTRNFRFKKRCQRADEAVSEMGFLLWSIRRSDRAGGLPRRLNSGAGRKPQ
jgi:hypothetical protein